MNEMSMYHGASYSHLENWQKKGNEITGLNHNIFQAIQAILYF